jgi:hypothetical protein
MIVLVTQYDCVSIVFKITIHPMFSLSCWLTFKRAGHKRQTVILFENNGLMLETLSQHANLGDVNWS